MTYRIFLISLKMFPNQKLSAVELENLLNDGTSGISSFEELKISDIEVTDGQVKFAGEYWSRFRVIPRDSVYADKQKEG